MGRSFAWVGDFGTEYPLATANTEVEWPLKGHLGAAWTFIEQAFASEDGASLTAVKAPPRDFLLPFSLYGGSENALDALLDTWIGLLTPDQYGGLLRATRNDGSQRDFKCNYKSGFDLAEESVASGRPGNAQLSVPLTFRGGPFWLDTVAQSYPYEPDTTTGLWFPVSFPYYLADSTIFARDNVINDGHVAAWPIWNIFGPGNGLKLTNETTNQSLSLDYTLDPFESVTIDTSQPGNRTVISSAVGNLLGSTTGSMFSLAKGPNSISIEFGSTTTDSSITLEFQRRFNNP